MFKNSVFSSNVNTVKWCKKAAVRAVKTMAQTASSMLIVGAFNETAWAVMVQTTLLSGLASVLTSLAGLPEAEEN